jgi:energy-coupling factor transporter ATP-binding protein EcfA2
LSTEGPDAANIVDSHKFEAMQAWLDSENVLLLCSPPGSGKTTFAFSFAHFLDSNGFKVTYLNASVNQSSLSDLGSMDDIWREAFDSDLSFPEMCTEPSDEDHYVIIDEAQSWYPINVDDRAAELQLCRFWADIKFYVKPALELSDYIKTSFSIQNSRISTNGRVRVLCLAGYGETNIGSIATPLVFVDPEDPVTQLRLPLGLEFLRLDRAKTDALITKFAEVKAFEGKQMSFDPRVRELIYTETKGHVGAIRTLLFHLVSTEKRKPEDVIEFTQRTVYETDLSAYRAFLSVSEATIRRLSPDDLATLLQSIVSYKKGNPDFPVKASQVAELIKLGIFVKTSATRIDGRTTVAFPSPLHFDIALYNILHSTVELEQTRECFERVLKELVLRMSPKVLQDTTPTGKVPLECQWQKECYRSFQSMSEHPLKTSVGREFNQHASLDIYINAGFQWGIELIREGDGRKLDEHVGRFQPGGRYSQIRMQEHAILNFTSEVPTQETLDMYDDHVWHLVYNDVYTKVTVFRKGKFVEDWDLIGHQGRTEY